METLNFCGLRISFHDPPILHRIIIPAVIVAANAFAADISGIPFAEAAGKQASLKNYSGKVVLVVKVASKCGSTTQYQALEALYKKYKDLRFVVLGFPCNDLRNQEPGSIAEIQKFCKSTYNVSFPIMNNLSAKGKSQHRLHEALTGKDGAFPGDLRWNFGMFLIGRDGKPIARFEPTTKPDSPEVMVALENALAVTKP